MDYSYIKSYTKEELIQELFNSSINFFDSHEMEIVKEIITNGLLTNSSHMVINERLCQINSRIKDKSMLLSKTYVKAFQRIQHFQKSLLGGVVWFEYVGNLYFTNCKICSNLLDKHFHINEILEMRNGIIEPVLFFGGGFECPHMWEADPLYRV